MASRRKKISLIAGGLVAVMAGCLLSVNLHSRWQLKSLRNELLAKGEKLSVGELVPLAIPAESNSAAVLIQAGASLRDIADQFGSPQVMTFAPDGKATALWRGAWRQKVEEGKVNTNTWEALDVELGGQRTALAEFRNALQQATFHRPVTYGRLGDEARADMRALLVGARVLGLDALRQMRATNYADASRAIVAVLKLARGWQPEPLFISEAYRQSIRTLAYGLTWEFLQDETFVETNLTALQDAWQPLRALEPTLRSVEMDRAEMLEHYTHLRTAPKDFHDAFTVTALGAAVPPSGILDRGRILWERADEGLRAFMREDVWLWHWAFGDERRYLESSQADLEALRALESHRSWMIYRQGQLGREKEFDRDSRPQRYLIYYYRYFPPHDLVERALRGETERSMAMTALALRRYELRHGRAARQLEDLVPAFLSELPRDWMDGKTLRWVPDAPEGRQLYSAGMNGTDDGGNPEKMPGGEKYENGWEGLDFVWPVAVPAGNAAR